MYDLYGLNICIYTYSFFTWVDLFEMIQIIRKVWENITILMHDVLRIVTVGDQ